MSPSRFSTTFARRVARPITAFRLISSLRLAGLGSFAVQRSMAWLFCCFVAAVVHAESPRYRFDGDSGGIIFNEDNNHFFCEDIPATREAITRYIDRYLYPGHQIREFFICVNAARACYPSKVFSPMWDGIEFRDDGTASYLGEPVENGRRLKAAAKTKELAAAGLDPFALWIAHLRKQGVSPWVSMRMNDVHDTFNPKSIHHSRFWLAHPEWRIAPYTGVLNDQALDYGVPEVREYHLAMAIEILERYDADGLELDWMRFGRMFKPGEEEKNAPLLTAMMSCLRAKADELGRSRGRRIRLAARVPQDPRDARRLGYDVEAWVREGVLDLLTVSPHYHTSWEAVPVAEWRRCLGNKALLAVCIEANKTPSSKYPVSGYGSSGEITNGLAASYFQQGADRIYLFNHFWSPRDILTTSGTPQTVNPAERRCYVSFNDTPAVGSPVVCRLPSVVGNNRTQSFRVHIGPAPEPGRRAMVLIAGRDKEYAVGDEMAVRVNGVLCDRESALPNVRFNTSKAFAAGFRIPDGILHEGENVVAVTNEAKSQVLIEWLEVHLDKWQAERGRH